MIGKNGIVGLLLVLAVYTMQCHFAEEVDEIDYAEYENTERLRDVEVTFWDSSHLRLIVRGPLLVRHLDRRIDVFDSGVVAEFYNTWGEKTGEARASRAERSLIHHTIVLDGDVLLYNTQGDSLYTSQLIWDERRKKIHTRRFVRLARPDRVIYGYGFESKEDFSEGEIQAIEGVWPVLQR